MATREAGDRHRRLLLRFLQDRLDARMARDDHARRGFEADVRVLSRALRSVRSCHRRTGREPVSPELIPFIDLRPGEDDAAVREAIERVVTSGWFILGPEVEAFETEFAAASGAAHAVG